MEDILLQCLRFLFDTQKFNLHLPSFETSALCPIKPERDVAACLEPSLSVRVLPLTRIGQEDWSSLRIGRTVGQVVVEFSRPRPSQLQNIK